VKLLRATDRLDEKGVGKSKRIGFVEFDVHEHALLTLRKMNNNPEAFAKEEAISKGGRSIRPMVEFALEDVRKLHLREMKKQAMEKRKAIREKQQEEMDAAEGKAPAAAANKKPAAAKGPKAKVDASQKPAGDKAAGAKAATHKKSGNLPDGGGRGACFTCGQTGHVSKNCPQAKEGGAAPTPATGNKRKASAAGESDTPSKKQKGSNGAATATPSSAPSSAATPAKKEKKNKNNKHKDSSLPKHLRDGEREEQQFDKLVQQHKQKFFGDSTNKESIKQAASRWFDM
jgi:nucleolar protein 4